MHLTPSQLSPADVQRLINFCAHHNHQTFSIAEAFVERVAQSYPAFRGALPLQTARQRHDLGCVVAEFARAFGHPEAMSGACTRAGNKFARCAMTERDMPVVRAALLDALKKHASANWTREIETAWNSALNAWLPMATPQHANAPMHMQRVRQAA